MKSESVICDCIGFNSLVFKYGRTDQGGYVFIDHNKSCDEKSTPDAILSEMDSTF